MALDDAAAEWLRQEHCVYSAVKAPFIPELVGWHDGERTLLAIADLSDAHWPPPWTPGQTDAVRVTLDELREFQRRQAEIALPWAARELGLPPP